MPVFGVMGVRKMFPQQLDIASQLILKWDRLGPSHQIDPTDDFTIRQWTPYKFPNADGSTQISL